MEQSCSDGKFSKKILEESSEVYVGRKPRDGSTVTLIFQNVKVSTVKFKEDDIRSKSYYLRFISSDSQNDNDSECKTECNATIGLSFESDVDRLLESLFTTMFSGEMCSFSIEPKTSDVTVSGIVTLQSMDDFPEWCSVDHCVLLERVSAMKQIGVTLFSNERIEDSFHKFSKGLKYLRLIQNGICEPGVEGHKNALTITLQNNISGCHIKLQNWEYAIETCTLVLNVDPNNVKALYRRGIAYMELQEYEKSRSDFDQAIKLDPKNTAAKQKLVILKQKVTNYNSQMSSSLRKMFN